MRGAGRGRNILPPVLRRSREDAVVRV